MIRRRPWPFMVQSAAWDAQVRDLIRASQRTALPDPFDGPQLVYPKVWQHCACGSKGHMPTNPHCPLNHKEQ